MGEETATAEWEWVLEDHTCSSCGAANRLHKQKPEWLEGVDGVKWECSTCGAANLIAGTGASKVLSEIVECGECHRTFDNREGSEQVSVDADGSWTCPGCSTPNRTVGAGESAVAGENAAVAS